MKQSASTAKVRPPRWPQGLVPWRLAVESFLHQLAKAVGKQIEIKGATSSQGDGSDILSFDVPGAGAGTATSDGHNWKAKKVDDTHITIGSGTVNAVGAKIGGVSIYAETPPQLLVDATDLNYIVLKITHTLSITDGRINSMTISDRDIEANTTGLPSSTSTEKYYLLLTWQAGALVAQNAYDNFGIEARDDGTSTSTPVYRTWRSSV